PTVVFVGGVRRASHRDEAVRAAVERWTAERPRFVEIGCTRRPGPRLIALSLGHHATFLLPGREASKLACLLAKHRADPFATAIATALDREAVMLNRAGRAEGDDQ
ncbi:MAG: hypothetical protein EA356_01330, partial [Geminicoccaceae bacterium]